MIEVITCIFLVVGAFFIFVAGIGILRMPDIFLRMSATTKAGTIGLGALLAGLAVFYHTIGIDARALATIGFVVLTAPVGAHRIGRIAYLVGLPLWENTVRDELEGVYPPDACAPPGEVCMMPERRAGWEGATPEAETES